MNDQTREGPHLRVRRADVLAVAVENRWILLAVFVACAIAGYCIARFMRPAYRAVTLVMPIESAPQGLLGGIVGQTALSGLGMTQSINKNEPIALIQSHSLLAAFLSEDRVVPVLCGAHAIKCNFPGVNPALVDERKLDSAIELFQTRILGVTEDKLTDSVSVSVIWYDRFLAATWCNDLVALTNRTIQERAEATAATRVKFLEEQYAKTRVMALQVAVSTALERELTKQMDAETQPDFAWRVVDRAWPPDDRYPARPLKAAIAAVAGLGGLLACLLFLLWKSGRQVSRR